MDNNLVNDIDKTRKLNRVACDDIDEGELDFAAEKLTVAISFAPNLVEPHANLGVSLCWEGEFEGAIVLHIITTCAK